MYNQKRIKTHTEDTMILSCHNINKAFGEKVILRDASFHIEEREKKDIEREKINQARIKRKQEREKAKLNQSKTNITNDTDINSNFGKKYPKRDLRINESDINKDL